MRRSPCWCSACGDETRRTDKAFLRTAPRPAVLLRVALAWIGRICGSLHCRARRVVRSYSTRQEVGSRGRTSDARAASLRNPACPRTVFEQSLEHAIAPRRRRQQLVGSVLTDPIYWATTHRMPRPRRRRRRLPLAPGRFPGCRQLAPARAARGGRTGRRAPVLPGGRLSSIRES